MNYPLDITLDLDRLPDLDEEDLREYLKYSPGESYRESINLDDNKNKKNLDISVILLCHGGESASASGMIKKKHNFWEDKYQNVMYNCHGELIVGIRANNIRVYNDIGFNVKMTNNIYKILIGAFYFNSLICFVFLYLKLNLFRSRVNYKKIYPYKKLYSIGRNEKISYPSPYSTNMVNGSNVQNSDYENKNTDKMFNYYIPNSSLGIRNRNPESDEQNYICFIIKNKGVLKIFKLILNIKNIKNIFLYNNENNQLKKEDIKQEDIEKFLENLNIADMITIIYNTIENKYISKIFGRKSKNKY